jgi:chromosome segregation ATPase
MVVMSNDPFRVEAKKMLDELNVHRERIKKFTKKYDSLRDELYNRRIADNCTMKELRARAELRTQIAKKQEELALAISEFEHRIETLKEQMPK